MTPEWLVIAKPAGWLTIPDRHSSNPLAKIRPQVLSDWAKQQASEIWVVHRLDRETSGVVLFGRTQKAHQQANLWFQSRKVKKVYQCLASGIPNTPVLKINTKIKGFAALTQVEVKESYQEGFLAQVLPRTGRRHQIRIHLAFQGFPLWGDSTYRGLSKIALKSKELTVSRVALHAASLELPTGERFEAGLPEDFKSWLNSLRVEGQRV